MAASARMERSRECSKTLRIPYTGSGVQASAAAIDNS